MRLVAQFRALFILIMLASYSPLGVAEQLEYGGGHLGISVFTGRLTRIAAAQQFDPTKAHVSRCPSRYVRRTITDSTKGEARENHR